MKKAMICISPSQFGHKRQPSSNPSLPRPCRSARCRAQERSIPTPEKQKATPKSGLPDDAAQRSMPSNSTSKVNTVLGGMTPGTPRAP